MILGTAALRDPALVREAARAHPGRVAVGIDARDGRVAVEGWAETTGTEAGDLATRFEDAGVAAIVYTDIERDGAMAGTERRFDGGAGAGGGDSGDRQRRDQFDGRLAGAEGERGAAGRGDLGSGALRGAGSISRRPSRTWRREMLKVRVIPCLDVKEGRVVKGVNFKGLVDAGDPVEAARAYDAAGADELCFLDIAASQENRGTLLDLATRTAEQCFMPLTVGGGVRTAEDVRALLLAGADKVSFNTAAIATPEVIGQAAEKFGNQCITVALDARTVAPGRWELFTHGGTRGTGIDAVAYAREMERRGAGEILLTSMDRDGTRAGYNLALTRAVADAVGIPVIASGGVGTLEHLVEGVTEGHASAVLAASIFHFGQHSIAEAKAAMAGAGIAVRV